MIVAGIQARMGSRRLPGKVLKNLWETLSVLEFMVERVAQSIKIDEIVILTSNADGDDEIQAWCEWKGVQCFRGDEDDVMRRVCDYFVFRGKEIEYFVDLTGDCPLVDPNLIDSILIEAKLHALDYHGNVMTRSWPDGFDVQVYRPYLLIAVDELIEDRHREHTGWNIIHLLGRLQHKYNGLIRVGNAPARGSAFNPAWGLTLDDERDLVLLREIVGGLGRVDFTAGEAIQYVLDNPGLLDTNRNVERTIPGA